MSYKKITVTGAEGFIGSHLVERLVNQGFEVKALVNYNFQNNWGWLDHIDLNIKKNIEVVLGDVRDNNLINDLVKGSDYVFNLAALIGIPYSYNAPKSYLDTNVEGLLNIMNAVKKENNCKIIHTSTSEVYGSARFVPMTEEHPLNAQSPYAASKIAADQLALSFHKSFDLPVSIIRPFNTYGPRQSLRAIIPSIITQYIDNKIKNIKLGNTNVTRDFTHISDTVDGFVSVISAKNIFGEIINLGSGTETKIKDILNMVSELTNIKKKIITEKARVRNPASEVKRLCSSNKKAKKLLNWKPIFSTKAKFKEKIYETIRWYGESENLKKFKTDIYNI